MAYITHGYKSHISIKLICSTILTLACLVQAGIASADEEIISNTTNQLKTELPTPSQESYTATETKYVSTNNILQDGHPSDNQINKSTLSENSPTNDIVPSSSNESIQQKISVAPKYETTEEKEAGSDKSTITNLPLSNDYARLISEGEIKLENNSYDYSLYKKPALNPNDDDDHDGILNKDEIYIYKKNNHEYIGYHSHPKLDDSDGDGLLDVQDDYKKQWYITDRDLAFFMELAYRDDFYIEKVLDETQPLHDLYQNRNEYRVMHKELAPFWRVVKTYHTSNGLDAILFGTHSHLPYLKDNSVHVLAFRGTQKNSLKDWYNDALILAGINPPQSKDVQEILTSISKNLSIQNLYITGHSLGGYLAQRFVVAAYQNYPKFYTTHIKLAVTFNAPKIIARNTIFTQANGVWNTSIISKQLTEQGKIRHYIADNDKIIAGKLRNDEHLVLNIGHSPFSHGSRYYVTHYVANNDYSAHFNIGRRDWTTAPNGYTNPQLAQLLFHNSSFQHISTSKPTRTPHRVIRRQNKKTKIYQNPTRGSYTRRHIKRH